MNYPKYLVLGSNGLVASNLKEVMICDTMYVGKDSCNLLDYSNIYSMIHWHRPDAVINCAGKVGGLVNNSNHQYDFLYENVTINSNVIQACLKNNVPRLVCLSSSCAYPDNFADMDSDGWDAYPLKESYIHDGPPTKSNFSYAYAKRLMQVQIEACNEQYGTKYSYLIPCNLYGPYDKFDEGGHFLGKLIRKIWEYKKGIVSKVEMLGSGEPLRQYMFCPDLAKIIYNHVGKDVTSSYNVGTNEVYSNAQIAQIAVKACGLDTEVTFTNQIPIGQHRKDIDILGMTLEHPEIKITSLYDGIKQTFEVMDKIWSNSVIKFI